MNRLLLAALALTLSAGGVRADDKEAAKEALKNLQEFIGGWNGSGGPVKQRPPASELWSETIEWGWKFKGGDPALVLKVEKGKHLKAGELRFLPDKMVYQLTLTDAKDAERVFQGEYK